MPEGSSRDVGSERRKSPRRSLHYSVRAVGAGAIQWDGITINVSESGAQLEFVDIRDIPDKFSLLIGRQGAVRRRCQVVWRSGDRLGVKFVKDREVQ
jgi:PilZ domain